MEEIDFVELLNVFKKKKFVVIAIVLIAILIGCFYSFFCVKPKYKSSTTLILGRIENITLDNNTNKEITQSEITINSNLVSTYSELIKSKTLSKEVIDKLGIKMSEDDLKKSINVSRIADTELIEITVTNQDPDMACSIANAIAEVFSNRIKEIYNISNVYIIDKAHPNEIPSNINHIRDISISTLCGLIISFTYVFIFSMFDNTIKTSRAIEKNPKIKNLISIPVEKVKKKDVLDEKELITYTNPRSVVSEAFRTLRTNVQFYNFGDKSGVQTFLITSAFQSEGKSYISANLATTFAQVGKKVILVDSDMRRGRQSEVFNIPNKLGLSNYISSLDEKGLEAEIELHNIIHETSVPNLSIITTGTIPPNPAELLASDRLMRLICNLKNYYDIIIFDGAPIMPIADSLILARELQNTILVALYNKTKKDDLFKVAEDIKNVGGKVIGTVINRVPIDPTSKGSRYYYYYYKNDNKVSEKEKGNDMISPITRLLNKIKRFLSRLKNRRLNYGPDEKKELEEIKKQEEIESSVFYEQETFEYFQELSNEKYVDENPDDIDVKQNPGKEEIIKVSEQDLKTERFQRKELKGIVAYNIDDKNLESNKEDKAKSEKANSKSEHDEITSDENEKVDNGKDENTDGGAKKETAESSKIDDKKENEEKIKQEEKAKKDAKLEKEKKEEKQAKKEERRQKFNTFKAHSKENIVKAAKYTKTGFSKFGKLIVYNFKNLKNSTKNKLTELKKKRKESKAEIRKDITKDNVEDVNMNSAKEQTQTQAKVEVQELANSKDKKTKSKKANKKQDSKTENKEIQKQEDLDAQKVKQEQKEQEQKAKELEEAKLKEEAEKKRLEELAKKEAEEQEALRQKQIEEEKQKRIIEEAERKAQEKFDKIAKERQKKQDERTKQLVKEAQDGIKKLEQEKEDINTNKEMPNNSNNQSDVSKTEEDNNLQENMNDAKDPMIDNPYKIDYSSQLKSNRKNKIKKLFKK